MQGRSGINYLIALLLIIVCSILLYCGYWFFYSADKPLASTRFYENGRQHSTLLVFLPGIYDSTHDFEKNGFISELARRKLPVDSMFVDAGVHYYIAKKIVQRLHTDIILPARVEGYRHIWLVGVSLGGFGALLYAKEHPENISGVITIAPYLGKETITRKIATAGSVANVKDIKQGRYDYIYNLWAWLEMLAPESGRRPPLFLAYGTEDKFVDANNLMASHLAKGHTLTIKGKHNWTSWKQLWQKLLDNELLTAYWLHAHQQ